MTKVLRMSIGAIEIAGLIGVVTSGGLVIFGLVKLLEVLAALGLAPAQVTLANIN